MPNAIKYSTSAQTLALKKGNLWIGTGDVGKGPSSTSSYYNGVTPAAGGYTIYSYSATQTGNLSYFSAANDAALIAETNRIAGTSYTTAAQCLSYFATQTDMMVCNIDYPAIVTNGLVMDLDAGFTPSYPTTGTTWYDISGNSNNSLLANGPTFNSSNSGSIVFDGVDDYVDCGTPLTFTNSFTLNYWFKTTNTDSIRVMNGMYNGSGADWWIGSITNNKFNFSFGSPSKSDISSSMTVNDGVWRYASCVYDKNINSIFLYINGSLQSSSNQIPSTVTQAGGIMAIGRFGSNGGFQWPGSMSTLHLYNRALNSSEVLQNFNATKGRFGL
jgi:hypothetical protein